MKRFGCLLAITALLLMTATLSAQSLDTASLDGLIDQGLRTSSPESAAPLDTSGLDKLEQPLQASAPLNLAVLDVLETPAGCKCPPGCLCVGDQCLCPQKSVSTTAPRNALAAEGWRCDAYMPLWCNACTPMETVEAKKAAEKGFPLHCIKGDENQFPAWVTASAGAGHGWPLIHIYNPEKKIGLQVWGRKSVEKLEEVVAWLKEHGEAWNGWRARQQSVAPPQSSLPVRYQQPAIATPSGCRRGRCTTLYAETSVLWV